MIENGLVMLQNYGEIEPADANLNVLNDEPAIPVVRIIREEKNSPRISYYAGDLVQAKLDNGEDILNLAV